jgi:hypothetical protein
MAKHKRKKPNSRRKFPLKEILEVLALLLSIAKTIYDWVTG